MNKELRIGKIIRQIKCKVKGHLFTEINKMPKEMAIQFNSTDYSRCDRCGVIVWGDFT